MGNPARAFIPRVIRTPFKNGAPPPWMLFLSLLIVPLFPVWGDGIQSDQAAPSASPSRSPAQKADLETAADQAAQEGSKRKALDLYLEALEPVADQTLSGNSLTKANVRIREKIIKLARTMDPKLNVPNDALRHSIRAEAFLKNAVSEGFGRAVTEYQQASNLAPWWHEGYFNLGLALEGVQDWQGALLNYELYLEAAPSRAPQAKWVRGKIEKLRSAGDGDYFAREAVQATPTAPKGWRVGWDGSGVFGTFATGGWPHADYGWDPYVGVGNLTWGFDTGIYIYNDGFFISPGFEYQWKTSTAGYGNSPQPLGILDQDTVLFRVKFGSYVARSDFFLFGKLGIGTNTLTVMRATFNSQTLVLTGTGGTYTQEPGLALDYAAGLGYGKNIYVFLEGEGTTTTNFGPFTDGSASTDPTLVVVRFLVGMGFAVY
jgi:tetratricopeptide (TPR) repeat protein